MAHGGLIIIKNLVDRKAKIRLNVSITVNNSFEVGTNKTMMKTSDMHPQQRSANQNRRAFTLIELLVVIAIIGILAAMLLPALNKAREKGRTAVCISNLRQISLSIHLYTDENDGYMPTPSYGAGATQGPWPKLLAPYMPHRDSNTNATSMANKAFICPSAKYPGYLNQDISYSYSCTGALLGHAPVRHAGVVVAGR